jgi:selT/selW/selH-like putative selenoprotein
MLAEELERVFPDVQVVPRIGRRSSFEVTANGSLLWSKLGGQGFPDTKRFVEDLRTTGKLPTG